VMLIGDFMANDQDTLLEKTKENEGAFKVRTSSNAVDVGQPLKIPHFVCQNIV
jgi:hypothetical protein